MLFKCKKTTRYIRQKPKNNLTLITPLNVKYLLSFEDEPKHALGLRFGESNQPTG